jgi:threonine/homoserine/homoserine lactone efflux protein
LPKGKGVTSISQTYLAFAAAVVLLCGIPGPDMAYLLGRTLTQGRRAGLVAALGINAGAYFHVAATVVGLSALLAASSIAFTVIKVAGACYLVWLGIRTLLSASGRFAGGFSARPASGARIFWEGFLSDALNPKVSIFFLAFLPQFVDKTLDLPVALQLLLLGVACNVIALAINVVLVLIAARAARALRKLGEVLTWLNRILGGLFVALGLRLAAEKL